MKINGKITLLFNEDGLNIEVHDDDAVITFLEIQLNQKQTCQALSRLSYTECQEVEVRNLDHVGKIRERQGFIFEMPKSDWNTRQEIAANKALELCPEGWIPDIYFGSQDSFFAENNVEYARTSMSRWIERD